MRLAKERQHMVLAERIERDVLDHHHLAVVLFEQSTTQDLLSTLLVALGEELHSFAHTHRSLLQALTLGVFAHKLQNLLDMMGYLLRNIFGWNKRSNHSRILVINCNFIRNHIGARLEDWVELEQGLLVSISLFTGAEIAHADLPERWFGDDIDGLGELLG